MNNQKLLVICGPTATGKTKLALHLAQKFNGEVISADSRQVYKHMRIGTGRGDENQPAGEIDILGYDLVNPNQEFSVSQYLDFANNKIDKVLKDGKLPILVGGTGLYIKAVVDGIGTVNIPPDKSLREKFKNSSVEELFSSLKKIDSKRANLMNDSDRQNPRRLVRAIETSKNSSSLGLSLRETKYDVLMIGLTAPKEVLKQRIDRNVEDRVKNGFGEEVEYLKKNGFWEGVPKVTLGYRQWPDIEKWKLEEFKYAKRQMTWFRREGRINWFDVTKPNYLGKVEKCLEKWHK